MKYRKRITKTLSNTLLAVMVVLYILQPAAQGGVVYASGPDGDDSATATDAVTEYVDMEPEEEAVINESDADAVVGITEPSVVYCGHVQNIGWMDNVKDGDSAGTTGRSLRVEAMKIKLSSDQYADSSITYCTHIQNVGWEKQWRKDGEMTGTSGRSLRLEAIRIKLSGSIADDYDVYYRVHAQNIGWMGWAKNGQMAGTQGKSYRLESLQIKLVKKGDAAPGSTANHSAGAGQILNIKSHVQNVGWKTEADTKLGTTGRGLRLEAYNISLGEEFQGVGGNIEYRSHIQNIGWENSWKKNGELSGTSGRALRIEAVQIKLTGAAGDAYDIYYRAHVQNFGWLDWAKNGESSGSEGLSLRVESIEMKIVPKGAKAPGSSARPFLNKSNVAPKGGNYKNGWLKYNGLFFRYDANGNVTTVTASAPTIISQQGYYISPMKTGNLNSSSERIEAMIARAYEYMNTPYVVYKSGAPGTGADCSGLVMQCLYAAGFDCSPASPQHHSYTEYDSRTLFHQTPMMHVSASQLRRGDLVYYRSPNSGLINHVAIYLGNGRVIESWPPRVTDRYGLTSSPHTIIYGVTRPFP